MPSRDFIADTVTYSLQRPSTRPSPELNHSNISLWGLQLDGLEIIFNVASEWRSEFQVLILVEMVCSRATFDGREGFNFWFAEVEK